MGYSGWPDDWDERKAGVDCPLCAELGSDTDEDHGMFVAALSSSEVRLERRSRLPGYCVVVWRHGHVTEPTELDAEAAGEYLSDVLAVSRAIEAEFLPLKMNLLTSGTGFPTSTLMSFPAIPTTLHRGARSPGQTSSTVIRHFLRFSSGRPSNFEIDSTDPSEIQLWRSRDPDVCGAEILRMLPGPARTYDLGMLRSGRVHRRRRRRYRVRIPRLDVGGCPSLEHPGLASGWFKPGSR